VSAVPIEDDTPSSDEHRGLRIMTSRRVALILFNLGGPDSPEAVQPFLFNLFNDPAIIGLPQPVRFLLAQLISRTRKRAAQANYAFMGGSSPLVPETLKQAAALETALRQRVSNVTFKAFPAMNYWRPFVRDVAKAVETPSCYRSIRSSPPPRPPPRFLPGAVPLICRPQPFAATLPVRRWRKRTPTPSSKPGATVVRPPSRGFCSQPTVCRSA
jgi:hypothetical protein